MFFILLFSYLPCAKSVLRLCGLLPPYLPLWLDSGGKSGGKERELWGIGHKNGSELH